MALHQVRHKVLRRFYEPLILLDALGQVRGDRIKKQLPSGTDNIEEVKQRRVFAEAIAYISAYRKECEYVTAVALESTPTGVVVWLAANGGIEPEVLSFLQDLFTRIQDTIKTTTIDTKEYQDQMHSAIIEVLAFNAPRNLHYYQKIRSSRLQPCFDILDKLASHSNSYLRQQENQSRGSDKRSETSPMSAISELSVWLKEMFTSNAVPTDTELSCVAVECHWRRSQGLFKTLDSFAQGESDYAKEFQDLHSLLCKLGKHVTLTYKLFEASFACRYDFRKGLRLAAVAPSKAQPFPLRSSEASVDSTIGRMYSDKTAQNDFRARLEALDGQADIPNTMRQRKSVKTLVHAELLLIDHFDSGRHKFLDPEDRYIACSKPSCYLCYAYIASHPGGYNVSASHQKLYIHWRVPDVSGEAQAPQERIKFQERILEKLIAKVRLDLQAEVISDARRRPAFPDSTADTTTIDRGGAMDSWLAKLCLSIADLQSNFHYEASSFTIDEGVDSDGGVNLE